MNEACPEENFQQGWNTLYITDVFTNVPFYVRGNEFTRQLYDFADAIAGKKEKPLCTFKDGVNTLEIIEAMFRDYKQNNY